MTTASMDPLQSQVLDKLLLTVVVEHFYDPTFFERDLSVINEGNESSNSSSGHPDARNVPYLLDEDELSFLMRGSHPSSDPTPGVSTNPTLRDVRAIRVGVSNEVHLSAHR